jgi:hypothetical protein
VLLTLKVGEVALLVELGLLETERVDDIDLGLEAVVGTLLSLLGGSVGTSVCAGLAGCRLQAPVEHGAQDYTPKVSPPMVILEQSAS